MISRVIKKLFRKPVRPNSRAYDINSPWFRPSEHYPEHKFGAYTYGIPNIVWGKPGRTLTVGKFCSIASNVTIMLGGNHFVEWVSTYPFSDLIPGLEGCPTQESSKGDVRIGNDVWIGEGSLILSGVSIEDGAVIGARSVVTKSVPAYTIVAGNPSREIRKRFQAHEIEALLTIRWWDWPIEQICRAAPLLSSDNIHSFIDQYGRKLK